MADIFAVGVDVLSDGDGVLPNPISLIVTLLLLHKPGYGFAIVIIKIHKKDASSIIFYVSCHNGFAANIIKIQNGRKYKLLLQ